MKTLAKDFVEELERCRELLAVYNQIGPSGKFAAITIEQIIQEADKAAIENDVVAMVKIHAKMKGCR